MVEAIAFISAIVAALLFAFAALGVPRSWATVAHGLVWLTISLTIWHVVAGLHPIFTRH